MDGYKPGTECSECKGKCCKDKGCSLSPEDMLRALGIQDIVGSEGQKGIDSISREALVNLLKDPERGLYTIDYISMPEGPCYYLRMRHKCYTFIGVDAMGECVALTEKGCLLSEEHRPKGGRYLESHVGGQCTQHYTRDMMSRDWEPYQELLRSIWNEYYPLMKGDGTFDKCDDAYFSWMKEQREGKQ